MLSNRVASHNKAFIQASQRTGCVDVVLRRRKNVEQLCESGVKILMSSISQTMEWTRIQGSKQLI